MSNVVQIGDYSFARLQRRYGGGGPALCEHKRLTLSDGDIVECTDCKKQVSAFWALSMLAEEFGRAQEKMVAGQKALAEAKAKDVSLLAAQRVEKAWRSRSMVPTCPHCNEAIFPQDGFGGSCVNREIALRRRNTAKSKTGE